MAIVYGDEVSHWSSYMNYDTKTYDDRVWADCSAGFASWSWGFDIDSGIDCELSAKYQSGTITGSGGFSSGSGSTERKSFCYGEWSWPRGHSAYSVWIYITVTNSSGYKDGTSTKTVYFDVPMLDWWWIYYDANGGSGAPGRQCKWYGENLTLSTSKPTRKGYSFDGWYTKKSGGTKYGETYHWNEGATLYAHWNPNKSIVKFDANGGTGAPGDVTKTYDVDMALPSDIPTRKDHEFLGWSENSSAETADYAPGAIWKKETDTTLYAIWKLAYVSPKVTNTDVFRCTASGVKDDEGTSASISFGWIIDNTIDPSNKPSAVRLIFSARETGSVPFETTIDISTEPMIGSKTVVVQNSFDLSKSYSLEIRASDSYGGSGSAYWVISQGYFTMDFKAGGKGIAFGAPSTKDGLVIAMPSFLEKTMTIPRISSEGNFQKAFLSPSSDNGKSFAIGGMQGHFGGPAVIDNSTNGVYSDFYVDSTGQRYYAYSNTGTLTDRVIRPIYVMAGDVISAQWWGAGYVTAGKTYVQFCIPIGRQIMAKNVTVNELKMTIRQNGGYCYGSSDNPVTPSKKTADIWAAVGMIHFMCEFNITSGVTNNDSIGIWCEYKLTFS